jgi:hypothetical protein
MDQDDLMIFQMMSMLACNSKDFFTSHEMEEGPWESVNLTIGVQDVFQGV